jgi:hypothetical protein
MQYLDLIPPKMQAVQFISKATLDLPGIKKSQSLVMPHLITILQVMMNI